MYLCEEQRRQHAEHLARRARMGAVVKVALPAFDKPEFSCRNRNKQWDGPLPENLPRVCPRKQRGAPNHNAHVVAWVHAGSPRQSEGVPGHYKTVLREVAQAYALTVDDLIMKSRVSLFVRARFEAMYRLRAERGFSFPRIGEILGNRDHSSIIHGVRAHCERTGLPYPDIRARYTRSSEAWFRTPAVVNEESAA